MSVQAKPYELELLHSQPSFKKSNKGVLLKFDDDRYSLYHPMEFFGDQPLEVFLKNLNLENPIFKRVSQASVSKEDFEVYKEAVVPCYYSAPSLEDVVENTIKINDQGFKTVKLKVLSLEDLGEMYSVLQDLPFQYVFDFNGKGNVADFQNIPRELSDFLKNRVKYIEDPCEAEPLSRCFKLASDFITYNSEDYKILKPTAFNKSTVEVSPDKMVVTSYLDHPLGQMMAGLYAVKNGIKNECGLLSHTYYKPNEYSEILGDKPEVSLKTAVDVLDVTSKKFITY